MALQDKTRDGQGGRDRAFWRNRKRPAERVAPASLSTRARFTRRSTIASCVIHCLQGRSSPRDPATTVVTGLPLGGDHPMHPFAITADGSMYVDVGTATNSCQLKNRTLKSPGADPCTELETRGGTWRFDANKTNQPFTPADRFATGIRNGEGFAD